MLLVKTHIGPSNIHGTGLFADESIPKGTAVWEFKHRFDLQLTREEISSLAPPAREQLLKYAYLEPSGVYVLCSDDARFFNHSNTPNTTALINVDGRDYRDIANRDINPGEELTADYSAFDANFSCGIYR